MCNKISQCPKESLLEKLHGALLCLQVEKTRSYLKLIVLWRIYYRKNKNRDAIYSLRSEQILVNRTVLSLKNFFLKYSQIFQVTEFTVFVNKSNKCYAKYKGIKKKHISH